MSKIHSRRERRFHDLHFLSFESIRLETFDNWELDFIDKRELAKCGFYYKKTEDHVKCFFCKGTVGLWEEGDDPRIEHKRHFPHCEMSEGKANGNVPIFHKNDSRPEAQVYLFLENYKTYRLENIKPPAPIQKYATGIYVYYFIYYILNMKD